MKGLINNISGKMLSAFLILTLLCNPLFGDSFQKEIEIEEDLKNYRTYSHDFDPGEFNLPEGLGCIDDRYKGNSGKIIFHIKDAHCNYDAQISINKLIENISKKYDVSLLSLEGGTGRYDLKVFDNINDPDIKRSLTDKYLREGFISGAELYGIYNNNKVILAGIEDPELYDKALGIYRSINFDHEKIFSFLDLTLSILEKKKDAVLTEKTKEYMDKKALFSGGEITISSYVEYLISIAGEEVSAFADLDNAEQIMKLNYLEKDIDFKKALEEREFLVKELDSKVSWYERKELFSLIKNAGERLLPEHVFYGFIIKKADALDIENGKYANLRRFFDYIGVYADTDLESLKMEINALEANAEKLLFIAEEEKEVLEYITQVKYLKKLFLLEADSFELALLRRTFNLSGISEIIEEELLEPALMDKWEKASILVHKSFLEMIAFHAISEKRDRAFVQNILRNMHDNSQDSSIVITGGFHSDNLYRLFKKYGISYVSINPSFMNDPEYISPYKNLLTGEEAMHEEMYSTLVSVFSIQVRTLWDELSLMSTSQKLRTLAARIQVIVDHEIAKGTPEILINCGESKKIFFSKKMGYKTLLWQPSYDVPSGHRKVVDLFEVLKQPSFVSDGKVSRYAYGYVGKEPDAAQDKFRLDDIEIALNAGFRTGVHSSARLLERTSYILKRDKDGGDDKIIKQKFMTITPVYSYMYEFDPGAKELTCLASNAEHVSRYMLNPGQVKTKDEKYYLCAILAEYFKPGSSDEDKKRVLNELIRYQEMSESRDECGWEWTIDMDESGEVLVDSKEGLGLKGLHIYDRTKLPLGVTALNIEEEAREHGGEKNVKEIAFSVQTNGNGKVVIYQTAHWRTAHVMSSLIYDSNHDPLTKAPNRRYFTDYLKDNLRYQSPVAILFIDGDKFKRFNDEYEGKHAFGDLVIRIIYESIKANIRKTDTAVRWGGEEFVVFLPDTSVDDAVRVATSIQRTLGEQRPVLTLDDGREVGLKKGDKITATIAVAGAVPAEEEKALNAADETMMRAKGMGLRNEVVMVGDDLTVRGERLEMDINEALMDVLQDGREEVKGEDDEAESRIVLTGEGYVRIFRFNDGDSIAFPAFLHLFSNDRFAIASENIIDKYRRDINELLSKIFGILEFVIKFEVNNGVRNVNLKPGAIQLLIKTIFNKAKIKEGSAVKEGVMNFLDSWFTKVIYRTDRFPTEPRIIVYPVYNKEAFSREMEMARSIRKEVSGAEYNVNVIPVPYFAGETDDLEEKFEPLKVILRGRARAKAVFYASPAFIEKNSEAYKKEFEERVVFIKEEGSSADINNFTYFGFGLRSALGIALLNFFDHRTDQRQAYGHILKDLIASLLLFITNDENLSSAFSASPKSLINGKLILRPAERIALEELEKKVSLTKKFLRSL